MEIDYFVWFFFLGFFILTIFFLEKVLKLPINMSTIYSHMKREVTLTV